MKTAASIVIYLLFNICAITTKAQTISAFSPQTGPVGTLVKIIGTNLSNPVSVSIGGVSAIVISNNADSILTMVMPGAKSGQISINYNGVTPKIIGNFVIIAIEVPTVKQGDKLIGSEADGISRQGNAVAVSADGNTAIIGAYSDGIYKGASWIFTRIKEKWDQGKKLIASDIIGKPWQGYSVGLSADGKTAIVGGVSDDLGQGAAWIYTKNDNGTWSQQGKKLIGEGTDSPALQGSSVSISADGYTAIIGGYGDGYFRGAAWVFIRNKNGEWKQQGPKLVGTGAVGNSQQGYAVALSADGNTAVVGGNTDNNEQGAIWVYIRNSNGVWAQQGIKLVGDGAIGNAQQGSSVSLNANGNTLIVAGGKDNKDKGAAWIFSRNGNQWAQQGIKLVSNGANSDLTRLKFSVSLNADGNIALIGGTNNDGSKGAALLFTKDGEKWTQSNTQLVGVSDISTKKVDVFEGLSVGMSADASTIILGSSADNFEKGSARIFAKLPVSTIKVVSSNANLNSLNLSYGVLSPTFSSEKNEYSINISKTKGSIEFNPIAEDIAAKINVKLNGVDQIVNIGSLYKIQLNLTSNRIEITVTAEDQQTKKTYIINIVRLNQTINIEPTTSMSFNTCVNSTSTPQSIKVSGSGLLDNILITTPAGFEISTKIESEYTNTLTLIQTEGIVASIIIYTRMISGNAGTFSGKIIISSTDVDSQGVPISGIVNELPIVNSITGEQQVCLGSTTKFATTTSGGFWSSEKMLIATVDAMGVITPVSFGTAIISYTVTNLIGCKTIVTREIRVDSLPKINAITGIEQTCKDGSTTFATTTNGGVWSSNNTLIASIIDAGLVAQINGIDIGTATIAYIVNNAQGCVNKVERNVTVYPKPLLFSITGEGSVCTGTTLFLANETTGGIWSVDSTYIATIYNNGELQPLKTGKVNVSYTVTNIGGCVSSVNKLITIRKTPDKPVITIDANLNLVSSSATGNTWYKSPISNPIDGATNKIYHPLLNGRYKVRINNADCLSDFSDEFVFITTPITILYPNPVNSFVIAQLESENVKRIFLLLVDNSGNIIESKSILLNIGKNEIRFNTEKLVKGSYFIGIKNYQSSSKMFVK